MTGKDLPEPVLMQLLETEFEIQVSDWTEMELSRARRALFFYDSLQDFFGQTGWNLDNPEIADEAYLISNRICRWVCGRLVYFSRILWEESA